MSGWIFGVQKLTESHSVVLRFEGAFVKLEHPEGTGQGEKEGGGREGRGWRSPPPFPQCQCHRCV